MDLIPNKTGIDMRLVKARSEQVENVMDVSCQVRWKGRREGLQILDQYGELKLVEQRVAVRIYEASA